MAYNNGIYPTGFYTPQYPQQISSQQNLIPQMQASHSTPQQNGNIIWVCGEAGAKSYLVAPNTTVQLWDSEAQTIYLKSADASGMPSIKTLDYTIRDRAQAEIRHENVPKVEFVTRDEFEALKRQIEALTATPKKTATRKSEVKDDGE